MRKTFFILLLAGLVLAGLVSCREETGTATLKLMLKKIEIAPKTLIPGNAADLRVARYTIAGAGPDNATFNISTDSPSVTINGLKIGDWHITATGVNPKGVSLVQGGINVHLDSNTGTTTIILGQLVGQGTLELTVDWVDTEVPNPNLELKYQRQGGSEQTLESHPNGERTVKATANLEAGSYIIRGVLKSGDFQVGGFVETARIVSGQTTSASVSISQMKYEEASASFYLDDKLGEPIRGTLSGFEDEVEDGTTFYTLGADANEKITFTLDEQFRAGEQLGNEPDFQLQWFLDGIPQGEPTTLATTNDKDFNVGPGSHRIDAVVHNNLLGSFGNASVTFEAIQTGEAGSISKLNDFTKLRDKESGTDITLGADTIVSPLPNGKFLVVSPGAEKVLVVKPVRNYIQVDKVFGTEKFSYVGGITGVRSDFAKPWVALQDGTQNLTFLKYNPQTDDLQVFEGVGRAAGSFSYGTNKTVNFGDIKGVEFNVAKGFVHIFDSSCKVNSTTGASTVLRLEIDEEANTLTLKGKDPWEVGTEFSVAPSGKHIAMVSGGPKVVMLELTDRGGILSSQNHDGLTGDALHALMVADDLLVASGTMLQSLDLGAPGAVWTDLQVHSDLAIANGAHTHVYSLDKAERTVTAFSRNSGSAALTKLEGKCVISSNPADSLEGMAISGSYLLVVSSSGDSGKLSLCRVL